MYDEIKAKGGEMPKIVTVGKQILDKGVELIKVLGSNQGQIKIDTQKYPKFRNVMKKLIDAGKFILPIIKLLI